MEQSQKHNYGNDMQMYPTNMHMYMHGDRVAVAVLEEAQLMEWRKAACFEMSFKP